MLEIVVGIALGLVIGFVVTRLWAAAKAGDKFVFVTDKKTEIDGFDEAKPFKDGDPTRPDDITAAKDKKRGKVLVGRARLKSNCVGFALGRGNFQIYTEHLDEVLKDNYTPVEKGGAAVCNIVVYGSAERGYDHIALVVEVDKDGKPTVVRSKATISDFVYDEPPNVEPYGEDFTVHNRTSTDQLPKAQQEKIQELRKQYEKIKDKSSKQAHDAAAALCQEKNALMTAAKPAKQ